MPAFYMYGEVIKNFILFYRNVSNRSEKIYRFGVSSLHHFKLSLSNLFWGS